MIKPPAMLEGESELDHLRRKQDFFGLYQGETLAYIRELELENELLRNDKERRCKALNATRNILNELSKMILAENFDMPADTFARDFAPFINVMGYHQTGETNGKKQRKRKA